MKFINVFKSIAVGLYRSIKRFPVTILSSTAAAVVLIVISEIEPGYDSILRDTLNRIAMIFALGVPLSLCIKLFFERKGNQKPTALIAY